MTRKLGAKPPRVDPRTFRLAKYVAELPPAPVALDWFSGITDFGMMGNDRLGDCVFAAKGHIIQAWTAATGSMFTLPDEIIISYYSKWAGYVPGDPNTDNGAVILDTLNQWRKEPFFDISLKGFADPDPQNAEHIRQSIAYFGAVEIGLALPKTAASQLDSGEIWDVSGNPYRDRNAKPYSWGAHDVAVLGYHPDYLECVTWGARQKMTWRFWQTYCTESHTLLSDLWLERAACDFHLQTLEADLECLKG